MRGATAALAGLLLAILPVTGPAWAHDGKLRLEVAGDGATGVTVQARHGDGHGLDEVVRLVLSATAVGGKAVGPLQLEPSGEGQGFYSSGPILTPGPWRVTVRAPKAHATAVTVEVRARAAQIAPAPAAQARVPSRTESPPWWRWWAIGLGVLAVVMVIAAVRRVKAGRSIGGR